MAETPLTKKLGIKSGYKLLILNAPPGYLLLLGEMPEGVEVHISAQDTYDWVQLFVYNQAEVDEHALAVSQMVKKGGLLWYTYPKKTGKIKTDISRDVGWGELVKAGWDTVTLVSVDDTWSAFRFRPLTDIKEYNRQWRK